MFSVLEHYWDRNVSIKNRAHEHNGCQYVCDFIVYSPLLIDKETALQNPATDIALPRVLKCKFKTTQVSSHF